MNVMLWFKGNLVSFSAIGFGIYACGGIILGLVYDFLYVHEFIQEDLLFLLIVFIGCFIILMLGVFFYTPYEKFNKDNDKKDSVK